MGRVRILIPTTEGPSEIQRLTEEAPEIRSVVCLDGRAVALPISPAYDAFVRAPTGLIERRHGHPAWRLDVSHPITDGASWQLGVLLAHELAAKGRLAAPGEAADTVVWATGEVGRDLEVRRIEALDRKIARSEAAMRAAGEAGVRWIAVAPAADLAALSGAPAFPVTGIDRFDDLLALIDPPAAVPAPVTAPEAPPRPRRAGGLLAAGLVAVAALGGIGWATVSGPTPAPPPAPVPAPATVVAPRPVVAAAPPVAEVHAELVRGARFGGCAGEATEPPTILREAEPGRIAEGTLAGLCRLRYVATADGGVGLILPTRPIAWAPQERLTASGGGSATVEAGVPTWAREVTTRLIVVTGRNPIADTVAAIAAEIDPAADDLGVGTLAPRYAGQGIRLTLVRHTLRADPAN
jgi:hypothetical protein